MRPSSNQSPTRLHREGHIYILGFRISMAFIFRSSYFLISTEAFLGGWKLCFLRNKIRACRSFSFGDYGKNV